MEERADVLMGRPHQPLQEVVTSLLTVSSHPHPKAEMIGEKGSRDQGKAQWVTAHGVKAKERGFKSLALK